MGRALPVKPSIALQQERGSYRLRMNQVVVPQILELVPQPIGRSILTPPVDRNQRGIWLVANTGFLGKRRSTPLNRLKEDQSKKITIFSRLPHLMGAMHIDGRTGRWTLEPRGNGSQHIVVGVLDGMEVELAARHWWKKL
jgi:hypothetical protein